VAGLTVRVRRAAEDALARTGSVAVTDVLVGIGWLAPVHVERWRRGRIEHLADLVPVGSERLHEVLVLVQAWAREQGLPEHEIVPTGADPRSAGPRSADQPDTDVEAAISRCWTRPDLPERQADRLVEKRRTPPELVVINPLKQDWSCHECGDGGDLLIMEDPGPVCLRCAGLAHLVFLPAGNATLTRRAKKASALTAVVVRFARARKRYERQGALVEPAALDAAEQSCLDDEEVRARRRERDRDRRAEDDERFVEQLDAQIRRLFPGCPPDRAASIAAWTGARSSGRVGRTAAGRALEARAVELAVIAAVRHEDTDYDALLMGGVPRAEARDRIRDDVDAVLDRWRTAPRRPPTRRTPTTALTSTPAPPPQVRGT